MTVDGKQKLYLPLTEGGANGNAASERPAPILPTRAAPAARRPPASWLSVDDAARVLGVDGRTLRHAIVNHARRDADGVELSEFDGVRAHRVGRRWRVMLDRSWLDDEPPAASEASS